MKQNKKLIQEMNKISNEINGVFIQEKKECNIMDCRNKPIHKFKIKGRIIFSCKKHKEDFNNLEELKQ